MTARSDIEIKLLLEAIFHRYHYDFRDYSLASVRRRVQSALLHFECPTVSALEEKILHDASSFPKLLQYLTVQVSDMFRDPGFYRVLRQKVVPVLGTYPSLKIWVAGCATGEEAYSFAILLREEGLLEKSLIYATDINGEGLRKAEEGVYSLSRMPVFTENHRLSGAKVSLSNYYTARYDAAVIDRTLRKHIVFSDHSLATDTVFAEVQLVSCRNVLIYFDTSLQDRAIGLFAEALCRRGFLGLGTKESLRWSAHQESFTDFDAQERWYQRT